MARTDDEFRYERLIGVGCFTIVGGFFAGGMISVFIGKIAGWLRRCEPDPGLPACDWHVFMLVGAIIGMITLPAGVFWRMRRRGGDVENRGGG